MHHAGWRINSVFSLSFPRGRTSNSMEARKVEDKWNSRVERKGGGGESHLFGGFAVWQGQDLGGTSPCRDQILQPVVLHQRPCCRFQATVELLQRLPRSLVGHFFQPTSHNHVCRCIWTSTNSMCYDIIHMLPGVQICTALLPPPPSPPLLLTHSPRRQYKVKTTQW
jgi:hypothetical protein